MTSTLQDYKSEMDLDGANIIHDDNDLITVGDLLFVEIRHGYDDTYRVSLNILVHGLGYERRETVVKQEYKNPKWAVRKFNELLQADVVVKLK